MIIGIRREDKNIWEKRVPLIPEDIKYLKKNFGIKTLIQPSGIRAFSDDRFSEAGALITEDIQNARTIFAIKEIPVNFFRADKTYAFFSHTIKGQSNNMPSLHRMMELKCNLIDYEKIIDESGKRLLFFGKYAGIAGMIETLHALGQKLMLKGFQTPFLNIKSAYKYKSIEEAKQELKEAANRIKNEGIVQHVQPLVFGFAGYGNVSKGAQEIFDLMPFKSVEPEDIHNLSRLPDEEKSKYLFKTIFKEKDLVTPKEGIFELQDYYDHPGKYETKFEQYVPHLSVLVNCIFWTEAYPRLITKNFLRSENYLNSDKKLLVTGDISCDINGAVEITYKTTTPGNAFYTYLPGSDSYEDGIQKEGITVMAVDNLPCEFPNESSAEFSSVLKNYVPEIVKADFNNPFEELSLSYPVKKALILHKGELTKDFLYLKKYLAKG